MKVIYFTLFGLLLFAGNSFAQCCAGGSGSPIAGGTSQGVLSSHQFELNTNTQYINSDKFYTGDSPDTNKYFDRYKSIYQYFRVAYGITSNLMISVETGYFFNKEEIGLNNDPSKTYNSKGFSDIIIFPRYDIFNISNERHKFELTLGLGYKIPIGTYNDSTGNVEPFSGDTYYVRNPQAVQLTTGAQDIIFYSFFYWGNLTKKFRLFANTLYIKKGWNPLGEKVGDYASVGLFAGKSFFNHLGLTLQVRGEWMREMKINEVVLNYGGLNYDPEATGYKKVFVSPQINYTQGKFTFYVLADLPVYQYLVKTQVGTQLQMTTGISFRFFAMKDKLDKIDMGEYYCPMHPEVTSSFKGKCPKCGMDLEKAK